MSHTLPQLQLLLLDLLGTYRPVSAESIAQLDDTDWAKIMDMAGQHRLKPLLHWRLQHEHPGLAVPAPILTELADSFKRSSVRQMVMHRELILTVRALNQAGIPNLALKGAYLAYHAYPHPALRPLRDIDILVPKDKALEAFETLLEQGWQRNKYGPGNPAAWLDTHHHLPGLSSASGAAFIELHHQLTEPEHNNGVDLGTMPELWETAISTSIAGTEVKFMSIPHLLLHLIEHAVDHHQLNNGSLFISDLAYLLQTHTIDWQLFWELTEVCQQVRSSCLSFLLVEHYYGPQAIHWPNSIQTTKRSAQNILLDSAQLTLCEYASRGDTALGEEINAAADWQAKLGVVWEKLFPSKTTIAATTSLSPNSPAFYTSYITRWWHLCTNRLPSFLRAQHSQHANRDLENLKTLKRWLKS